VSRRHSAGTGTFSVSRCHFCQCRPLLALSSVSPRYARIATDYEYCWDDQHEYLGQCLVSQGERRRSLRPHAEEQPAGENSRHQLRLSSLKYSFYDTADESRHAHGLVERIGIAGTRLAHRGPKGEVKRYLPQGDFAEAFKAMAAALTATETGVLSGAGEIGVVAHWVVHGGERGVPTWRRSRQAWAWSEA
jgi:Acetokinase family